MRVLIQFPEGLKRYALSETKELEKEGHEVVLFAEPCYGACDVRIDEARRLGCEKIIHIGHTEFLKTDFPVEYRKYKIDFDSIPILEKEYHKLSKFKSLCIITTAQHVQELEKAKKYLEKHGHTIFISKGIKTRYPGQILGCDQSAATLVKESVDAFLFIGSGKFHAIGLKLKVKKPVFVLDLEKKEIYEIKADVFEKQKWAAIACAKDAHIFGILISTKPGQIQMELALELKRKLEQKGKTALLIALDEIKPQKLLGLEVDAWINTACPRIAIEHRTEFKQPILNPDEIDQID